jgi:hypothetical protein
MDCRVKPGNDEMEIRSRDASAPEVCQPPQQQSSFDSLPSPRKIMRR